MHTLLAAGLIATAALITTGTIATPAHAQTTQGRVVGVVDGDTVQIRIAGKRRIVNLIGLTTLNRRSCTGTRAKIRTSTLLRRGTQVTVRTPGIGRIRGARRITAEVYVKRGRSRVSVNLSLITTGHARILSSARRATSPAFTTAQRRAKSRKLGTWSAACADRRPARPLPTPPPPAGETAGDPETLRAITALISNRRFSQVITNVDGADSTEDQTDLDLCADFRFQLHEFSVTNNNLTGFELTNGLWSLAVESDFTGAEILLHDDEGGSAIPTELTFGRDAAGQPLVYFDGELFSSEPSPLCGT